MRVDVRRQVCSCRQVGRCEHLQFLTFVLRERAILFLKAEARSKENPTSTERYLQQLEISVRDLVEEGRHHPANISHSTAQDEGLEDIPSHASSSNDPAEEEESNAPPLTASGEVTSHVGRKRCCTDSSDHSTRVSPRRLRSRCPAP